MGSCFSRNTKTATLAPTSQQLEVESNLPQPQKPKNELKKEIFVIKHRPSQEIERHPDDDARPRVRTSSCSKEEVDAILLQCGRLSRSTSTHRRRRSSGSKTSFDFDSNNDDDDNHHHRHRQRQRQGSRVSSPSSSKERRRDKARRISISPSRRSESPFRNSNSNGNSGDGGGSNRPPTKMVSVPATDKSNIEVVKRIHVKRNVGAVVSRTPRSRSPARRTNIGVFREDEQRRQSPYKRVSLAEIDNNATRSLQHANRYKEQQKMDEARNPSPPSYASLLLEDIHKFHQKNMNANANATVAPAPAPPGFSLPACVSKACSIMEAVADLNSTSSLCTEDRWRNPSQINRNRLVESDKDVSVSVSEEQEFSSSNSCAGSSERNSGEPERISEL